MLIQRLYLLHTQTVCVANKNEKKKKKYKQYKSNYTITFNLSIKCLYVNLVCRWAEQFSQWIQMWSVHTVCHSCKGNCTTGFTEVNVPDEDGGHTEFRGHSPDGLRKEDFSESLFVGLVATERSLPECRSWHSLLLGVVLHLLVSWSGECRPEGRPLSALSRAVPRPAGAASW